MTSENFSNATKLMPVMRYRDVGTAINWLCAAFGFETYRVVAGDDGTINIAQLCAGANMIVVLPVGGSELDALMKQPDEIGGAETQSCYLVVEDVDFHYTKAKAMGAQFLLEPMGDESGRRFSCRDPEGHIWSFGTYNPWHAQSRSENRMLLGAASRAAAMVAIAILAGTAGWELATLRQAHPGLVESAGLRLEFATARERARQATDRASEVSAELSLERSKRVAIERTAQQARDQIASVRTTAAQATTRQLEQQLAELRRAREAAEQASSAAVEQMERERQAKEVSQKAKAMVQNELALAQAAKQLAERSAREASELLAREQAARKVAEQAAEEVLIRLSQAQGAGKVVPHPVGPARKMSRKPTEAEAAEPMPPLLP